MNLESNRQICWNRHLKANKLVEIKIVRDIPIKIGHLENRAAYERKEQLCYT